MLNSGSTISLLQQDVVSQTPNPLSLHLPAKRLISAFGQPLKMVGCVLLPVSLQDKGPVLHQFALFCSLLNCLPFEFPDLIPVSLTPLVHQYKSLFGNTLGATTAAFHHILTSGAPVRISLQHILLHYKDAIHV